MQLDVGMQDSKTVWCTTIVDHFCSTIFGSLIGAESGVVKEREQLIETYDHK